MGTTRGVVMTMILRPALLSCGVEWSSCHLLITSYPKNPGSQSLRRLGETIETREHCDGPLTVPVVEGLKQSVSGSVPGEIQYTLQLRQVTRSHPVCVLRDDTGLWHNRRSIPPLYHVVHSPLKSLEKDFYLFSLSGTRSPLSRFSSVGNTFSSLTLLSFPTLVYYNG